VAAAKTILTGDGPTADTQDDSNPRIERVVRNDGNTRDLEPTVTEYGNFPMDAASRTGMGNPPPLHLLAPDRSMNHHISPCWK